MGMYFLDHSGSQPFKLELGNNHASKGNLTHFRIQSDCQLIIP